MPPDRLISEIWKLKHTGAHLKNISINFLKTVGDHMEGSGIDSIWVQSGLLGQNETNV